MNKVENTSLDLTKLNIEKIKELFPNVITEGKIDFELLKIILGDYVDDSVEKYQFTWNGKQQAIKIAQSPSTSTLRPCKEKSKDWDTTENFYIEGDNLEVLKQLQKTYYGKIKMIYIDPPYNTGNDFVYQDNFKNNIENYKEQTSQASKSNPETNGRYHTDWLNMIYPRLLLAKNLLKKEGVIFISIDDREQEKLKLICNEIFGEQNFLAQIIWERAFSPVNLKKHFSESHDFILCYAKNIEYCICNGLPRTSETDTRYSNPDNDERGVWTSSDMTVGPAIQDKLYDIKTPSGKIVRPASGRCWLYTKDKYEKMVQDNRIWFGKNGGNMPRVKKFLSEVKEGITPMTIWKYTEVGHSQEASQNLKKLFCDKSYFDYPKPINLIQRCLKLYCDNNDVILDFFSGSATTAHAAMKLNATDNSNLKFIMVQLPEMTDEKSEAYKAGYTNICEIGEERIRRAGEQIKQEWLKENLSEGLFANEKKEFPYDIGFKVFRLDSSNIKPWDNELVMDEQTLFDQSSEVFKKDRTNEDILYEIMLKYGVFDEPVTEIEINSKTMYRVGKRHMIVCLDDNITSSDVSAISELKPKVVIFKESGFENDNDKINAVYNLEKAGIEDVKSI